MIWLIAILVAVLIVFILSGIRIVRPVERALIERLGKYSRFASPGFNWIIPIFETMIKVNITENMIDAKKQSIITDDNLNAEVDAQIYYKVKPTEEGVKQSQYYVSDYEWQIVNLARTTLRNIIGKMSLKKANSDREQINNKLMKTLLLETKNWGIEVVRTEIKEIDPPENVQRTMNEVVMAENKKIAAKDLATAKETEADGERRSEIKKAEGQARAIELVADAEAKKIKIINESSRKYFRGNAVKLRQLEAVEKALAQNTKYIVDSKTKIAPLIGDIMDKGGSK